MLIGEFEKEELKVTSTQVRFKAEEDERAG